MFHNLAYCPPQHKPASTALRSAASTGSGFQGTAGGYRALKRTADNRLAYRDTGPTVDGAVSILLVHGWGVSGALFSGQAEALAERFRVVAPDLPGHGDSAAFSDADDFSLLADSLAGLLTELDLDRVCLVGWSLGALVAWDLLQRHPEVPIDSLVTIDMVPRLLNDDSWHFGLREGADHHVFDRHIEWMTQDWPSYTELFVSRIFAADGSARSELRQRVIDLARRNDPLSMAAIWKRMVEQDLRTGLAGIRQPTLVVAGRKSQIYGEAAAQWIVRQVARAQLVVFGDSGHAPHLEQPQIFNRLLAEFAGSPDEQANRSVDSAAAGTEL